MKDKIPLYVASVALFLLCAVAYWKGDLALSCVFLIFGSIFIAMSVFD